MTCFCNENKSLNERVYQLNHINTTSTSTNDRQILKKVRGSFKVGVVSTTYSVKNYFLHYVIVFPLGYKIEIATCTFLQQELYCNR